MKHKTILLALSAVAAVMFALPAVASAGEWEISTAGESFTLHSGTTTTLTEDLSSAANVTCSETNGTGHYAAGSKTTSEQVTLTFTGCLAGGFIPCNTPGQSSGTIKTTDLTGHNIMIDPTPTGKAGILLTPNGTHFATFECFGVTTEVTGNGIIGEVEQACGTAAKKFTVNYESPTKGTQKYMQITTSGTKYDLDAKEGTNAALTASEDGTGEVTFANTQTINCP